MKRVTLEEYLQDHGSIQSGIIVNSTLTNKLEIYGFVNACRDEDMYNDALAGLFINGVINKEPSRQIVLSNYIYQVTHHYRGKEIIQVFRSLCVSKSEECYNVEDLYIPSLIGKTLYKKIKSRFGNGVPVRESKLRKEGFPSNIIEMEGKAIFKAPEGHIQLLDKDFVTKSIGENIMAVCRYLHDSSGTMCYTQYNLNELYIDDIH